MVWIGITCNQLSSDGRRKVDSIYKGPTSSHSVTKQANLAHSGRTDAVDFIVDRCSDRHAGTGFRLSQSMRRRMSVYCITVMRQAAAVNFMLPDRMVSFDFP